MSAHKKLMQARIALQSKKLKKSGHNKFAGYQYFELGDFLPTIQEIFRDLNLCGVVSYGTELATLTITDMEDSSSLTVTSPMSSAALKGCHEVQNLGAVQTYIRRYLWVTAMEIVEHDALDSSEPLKDAGSGVKASKNVTPISAPKESAKSVTASVFESLPEHEQVELVGIAADVAALSGNPKEALEFLEAQDLDADHKTALWSLLDSRVRAAIKKEKEAA